MDGRDKISVSQLLILLTLSRFFSLVAYSPQALEGGRNITILTTLVSGVFQYLALMLGIFFCRRSTGLSPLMAPGGAFFRVQSGKGGEVGEIQIGPVLVVTHGSLLSF